MCRLRDVPNEVHEIVTSVYSINKAGYTATLIVCGWAGAMLEKVTWASGHEPYAQKAQKRRESKQGTNQPIDHTNRPTDRHSGV